MNSSRFIICSYFNNDTEMSTGYDYKSCTNNASGDILTDHLDDKYLELKALDV